MKNDPSFDELYSSIFGVLENEFKERGFELYNFIDLNTWFLKDKLNLIYELIESGETPGNNKIKSNDTDIIVNIFYNKFLHLNDSSKKNEDKSKIKINCKTFINEISNSLINIYKDVKRVNRLIKKYNAYETLNLIELNLNNLDELSFRNEGTKSKLSFYIKQIQNFPTGDYKFTLLCEFMNTSSSSDLVNSKEKNNSFFEYKLNNIIKISGEDNRNIKLDDCKFKAIEFFSYEKSKKSIIDSGTNFLSYSLLCENMSVNNSYNVSNSSRLLDLFLGNIEIMLNKYKKNKHLETLLDFNFSLDENGTVYLGAQLELDPFTYSSIFSKIKELLKDLVSTKVKLIHKFKMVLNYFPEIEEEVYTLFYTKLSKSKKKIVINYENEIFKVSDSENESTKKSNKKSELSDDSKDDSGCYLF